MNQPQDPLQRCIAAFGTLPGIGEKTAARLTFFLLRKDPQIAAELSAAIVDLVDKVRRCRICQNFTIDEQCAICADQQRQDDTICVVESVADVWAIERSGTFRGRYHILHGTISPIDGIGPNQLTIDALVERVRQQPPREVIIATGSDSNGETTALYLLRALEPFEVTVTRIASGIPTGSGGLEYIDGATLEMALAHRRSLR